MKLNMRGFLGLMPKLSPELLPESAATVAENCFLENGDVQPMRSAELIYTSAKVEDQISLYYASDSSGSAWFTWSTDVNVAREQFGTEYRYYWTGDGAPKMATIAMATTGGGNDYPASSRDLGIVAPTAAATVTPSATGTGTTISRYYAYTFYSDMNEEGPISPLSALVTGKDDDTWALSGMTANPANCTKRIYRSEGTAAQFQLVAEGVTGTTYNDTLATVDIPGDELISSDWSAPPANLKGLIRHPCGSMVGFDGTKLLFSEIRQPHAWPAGYAMNTEYDIVGIAMAGTAIVVATTSLPYLCIGNEPGAMQLVPGGEPIPCVSKRSVISMGDRVAYSSPVGAVSVSENGVELITKEIYDYLQWQQMRPDNMVFAYSNGKLHILTSVM